MNRGTALLAGAALLAALGPAAGQLAFAVGGIGIVGMVHGAGDLAMVDAGRRTAFLACYGAAILAVLAWWTLEPAAALPAFLIASAVHFAVEDAPLGSLTERIARGVALIAAPASVHPAAYAALLRTAGGAGSAIPQATPVIAVVGACASVVLLWLGMRQRNRRLLIGTSALLALPPLVGFTLGFLILHALPQTAMRRDRLGHGSTAAYLRAVGPVLIGAVFATGLVAAVLLWWEPTGIRGLFGAIAALAIPHLLVTPWFEMRRPAHRALAALPVA